MEVSIELTNNNPIRIDNDNNNITINNNETQINTPSEPYNTTIETNNRNIQIGLPYTENHIENSYTFNQDYNLIEENSDVKAFTDTGYIISDESIFSRQLNTIITKLIQTKNGVYICISNTNKILISKNGIDFSERTFDCIITNIFYFADNRYRYILLYTNQQYIFISKDDGETWKQSNNYLWLSNISKTFEFIFARENNELVTYNISINNEDIPYLSFNTLYNSDITPNFISKIKDRNSMYVYCWCDTNCNFRYKQGSTVGTIDSCPLGTINKIKNINDILYVMYENDTKISYLTKIDNPINWQTITLPEICTVNDIIYNPNDNTYYILTNINNYYKTQDFNTFESININDLRGLNAEYCTSGLFSSTDTNKLMIAPNRIKIENKLQEFNRNVDKQLWIGKGLELEDNGEKISVKATPPLYANYGSLVLGQISINNIDEYFKKLILIGSNPINRLDPNTFDSWIWEQDLSVGNVINIIFTNNGIFHEPYQYVDEYNVEKGELGYIYCEEDICTYTCRGKFGLL